MNDVEDKLETNILDYDQFGNTPEKVDEFLMDLEDTLKKKSSRGRNNEEEIC